jgi:hypothetical protein
MVERIKREVETWLVMNPKLEVKTRRLQELINFLVRIIRHDYY